MVLCKAMRGLGARVHAIRVCRSVVAAWCLPNISFRLYEACRIS